MWTSGDEFGMMDPWPGVTDHLNHMALSAYIART